MKLTFCGAAKTVTGSNYLLEEGDTKILVDCGLNQGPSYCEDLNFEPFKYDPKEIKAVFVTHAHLDHIGRLPSLVKAGFDGTIYSTPPTKDFAELLLLDSEHLLRQESDKRHQPPLYDASDILKVMAHWQKRKYHEKVQIGPFEVETYDAGHILGSASVVVRWSGKEMVFSGDLGNTPAPYIHPTEYVPGAQFALVESAYGDRLHEGVDERKAALRSAIVDTIKKGGVLMVPAFAMERTQDLLYAMNDLVESGDIPRVPVFVDSPLAIKLTAVYQKYASNPDYFNGEAVGLMRQGDAIFDFPGLHMTLTKEQSKEINDVPGPKVVIAGAGMMNGGRILHHAIRYLPDEKSTLLVVGYQAKGSLGQRLVAGESVVKIFGEEVNVRAKILNISGFSAHADQNGLVLWVRQIGPSLQKLFVCQGEEESEKALAAKIKEELNVEAATPSLGDETVL
ncbi:MBL fold metallo-hydrolase [Patescibacteria group bacterium]|nr:MBL fold metallo-hydrolase [Patescibacteria group bacterium]